VARSNIGVARFALDWIARELTVAGHGWYSWCLKRFFCDSGVGGYVRPGCRDRNSAGGREAGRQGQGCHIDPRLVPVRAPTGAPWLVRCGAIASGGFLLTHPGAWAPVPRCARSRQGVWRSGAGSRSRRLC
jgi:hypothetical protein